MHTFIKINNISQRGFTLVEIILGMTIFGLIMTSVLLSVQNMSFARIKTENRVKLLEELYFFSEKLSTNIKEGGTLDYEEYWNRNSYNTVEGTGHYMFPTGVGNYGSGGIMNAAIPPNYGETYYLCRSGDVAAGGVRMGTGGCLSYNNDRRIDGTASYTGVYQRYGQYALQYYDYNGNADADLGDEDGDITITNDEDDKDIGDGPIVISGALRELYLIDKESNTRTFFRWIVRSDPNAPAGTICIESGVNTGSGCVGNIQILKLRGVDLGFDHTGTLAPSSNNAFDGTVDTWICHEDWACSGPQLPPGYGNLATGNDVEWIDIFPDTVNVKSIKFIAYPKKDPWAAWNAPDAAQGSTEISPFIHPYARVELTLGFAWGKRRMLQGDDPTISVTTSISLADI
ncbi:type II secretion system protein [Candidatus Gracilibacteria bacterium]|nr:type II secretion system protein [Candidatus Gracilibacteria bacterium]